MVGDGHAPGQATRDLIIPPANDTLRTISAFSRQPSWVSLAEVVYTESDGD